MLRFAAILPALLALAGCVIHREYNAYDGVTNAEVVRLVAAGVSNEVIIAKIRTEGIRTPLSSNDLIALREQGVPDPIVSAMLNARLASPPREVQTEYRTTWTWWPWWPWGWYGYWHGSWSHHGGWHHDGWHHHHGWRHPGVRYR